VSRNCESLEGFSSVLSGTWNVSDCCACCAIQQSSPSSSSAVVATGGTGISDPVQIRTFSESLPARRKASFRNEFQTPLYNVAELVLFDASELRSVTGNVT